MYAKVFKQSTMNVCASFYNKIINRCILKVKEKNCLLVEK